MGEGITYSLGQCSGDKRREVGGPLRMTRFGGSLEVTGPFRCWSAVDRWQSSLQLDKGAGPEGTCMRNSGLWNSNCGVGAGVGEGLRLRQSSHHVA